MKPSHYTIFLTIFVFITFLNSCSCTQPTIVLNRTDLQQIKKAQIYLQKQLQMYDHNRADYYTLYLAVKSYADRLNDLQQLAFDQYVSSSPSQATTKKIKKIILGSSTLASLTSLLPSTINNFVTAYQNDLNDPTKRVIFLKNWTIAVSDLIDIQDHPQSVITNSLSATSNLRM